MRKLILVLAFVGAIIGTQQANAQYYLRGSFNGYDTSLPMTDLGGGVFEAIATGLNPGDKYTFLAANSDYSIQSGAPFEDVAARANAAGQIRVRFYENDNPNDGWSPNLRRLGLFDLDYSYELMGSFNGFSAPLPLTNNGGVLQGDLTLSPNTSYNFVFRQEGTWDVTIKTNFGDAGPDINYTTGDGSAYRVSLDLNNGRYQFSAVPEPSTFLAFGLASLGLCLRRRK